MVLEENRGLACVTDDFMPEARAVPPEGASRHEEFRRLARSAVKIGPDISLAASELSLYRSKFGPATIPAFHNSAKPACFSHYIYVCSHKIKVSKIRTCDAKNIHYAMCTRTIHQ